MYDDLGAVDERSRFGQMQHSGGSDVTQSVSLRLSPSQSIVHDQQRVPGFQRQMYRLGNYSAVADGLRQGGIMGRPSKTDLRASSTLPPFLRIVEI